MKHTYTSNELAKGAQRQAQPTDTRRQRRGLGGFLTLGLLLVAAAGGIFWFVRTGSTLSVREKADVAPDNSPGSHSENGSQKKVSDKDVVLYVESTEGEIRQLFEYVRQSALVQENVQYSSLMKDVGFAFDATNDEVNAVASRRIKEGGGETRLITCYAGEARFAKTIALAAAAELNGEKGEVAKMMGKMTPMLCFQLSAGDAVGLVRSCGLDRYLLPAWKGRGEQRGAAELGGTGRSFRLLRDEFQSVRRVRVCRASVCALGEDSPDGSYPEEGPAAGAFPSDRPRTLRGAHSFQQGKGRRAGNQDP